MSKSDNDYSSDGDGYDYDDCPGMTRDIKVATTFGMLIGRHHMDVDNKTYYAFKKIPYAKSPVLDKTAGDENRRFLDPSRPDELKDLDSIFKSENPQFINTRSGEKADIPRLFRRNFCAHKFVNEDQLFVNVYTPEVPYGNMKSEKPVMVFIPTTQTYIHPGLTKTDFYNPEYFMREGIVVVVVSYRSGILGFLDTDSPKHGPVANAGLKDIKMALEWVQRYIYIFHGDNKNVTLCGQGFGAALVHFCLLNKKTHHLYHRVIMQSGCALNNWAFNEDKRNQQMKEKFLKEHSFEELQAMDLEDLLIRAQNHAELPFINEQNLPLFGPTIEKPHERAFITAHPMDIMESDDFTFEHPVIIGYNSLEGLPLVTEEMMSPAEHLVMNFIGDDGKQQQVAFEDLMKDYGIPPDYRHVDITVLDKTKDWVNFITDAFYLRAIRATALKLSEKNPNVYFYKFSCDSQLNVVKERYPKWAKVTGAAHGDELGYLFKIPKRKLEPRLDIHLGNEPTIMNVWVNFIDYGDPNPIVEIPCYVGWPVYEKKRETYMVFAQNYDKKDAMESKIKITYVPELYRMKYWDEKVTKDCLSHVTMPALRVAEEENVEVN